MFMGGLAFMAGESVLPALVKTLGGPNWVISLTPSIMWLGSSLPSLFTAHRFERLPRYMPVIVIAGFFQRIFYVLAGLALIFLSARFPKFVLATVVLTPLLSGISGGVTLAAWQALTIKVIPENRRASLWAFRFIIGSCIGVFAGSVVKMVLQSCPGMAGFGILHLIESGFLVVSMILFMLIKESPHEPHPDSESKGILDNFKDIPELLHASPAVRNYIVSGMIGTGFMIMTPFLAIHILDVTGQANSFLGILITSQMIGGLAGNLLAGYIGDVYGGKLPSLLGKIVFFFLPFYAIINHSTWGSLAVFFMLGFGSPLANVGGATLAFDICPARRRITYLSILAAFSVPALLGASLISTVIRETMNVFWPLAMIAGLSQLVSIYFLLKIPEPGRRGVNIRLPGTSG
jgi:MFS family permease